MLASVFLPTSLNLLTEIGPCSLGPFRVSLAKGYLHFSHGAGVLIPQLWNQFCWADRGKAHSTGKDAADSNAFRSASKRTRASSAVDNHTQNYQNDQTNW